MKTIFVAGLAAFVIGCGVPKDQYDAAVAGASHAKAACDEEKAAKQKEIDELQKRVADADAKAGAADEQTRAELEEYFEGRRHTFDIPLAPNGTDFQRSVWRALTAIPYGQTISYAELARRVGNEAAVRAVGAANGRNPIPVIVPCHRVIGSDGSLTGFGGGLPRKKWLLQHERALPEEQAELGV